MMLRSKKLVLSLILFVNLQLYSQELFNELSISAGYVSFRGDYGERQDGETNLGNTGLGISAVHYLNFAYSTYGNNYFSRHFKLRNQLLYQNTSLEHLGKYAKGDGDDAFKLSAMTGEVNTLEVSTGLQWFYKRIKEYEISTKSFSPYAGAGIGAVYANPSNRTSLPGELGSATNTFETFLPQSGSNKSRIINDSEIALAVNFQTGTFYRLSSTSDLFLELSWHFYSSDFIDGLSPVGDQNRDNDWTVWLSLGYVFYFGAF